MFKRLIQRCAIMAVAGVFANVVTATPASQWNISGSGDSSIQGFTTDISANLGDTVHFKISTNASAYHLDIYRMGYYGGDGASLITTIQPSAKLPQSQPACLTDSSSGLLDCGNWAESASWTVPTTAKSGIYFAKVTRNDTSGASHIFFVVRDDSSHSAILFQTSDTTWQAYNQYGGNSLYVGGPGSNPSRAYKVTYNRPITTRGTSSQDFVFNAEYPMVRWLEANGYDVSYSSGVDSDRRGALLLNHKIFLSVGHDEYWSGAQRANVEAARAAGVHLVFLSGNEVFWKTRWESSIDGSNTTYRTMVAYKETHANGVIDPDDPPTWTGTWRDPRFSPPGDGGRPENGLTGTIYMVDGCGSDNNGLGIKVPAADGLMRFWRNTTIATLPAGQTASLPGGTLGYEWDVDADNGARPPGLFDLSTSTYQLTTDLLLDYGSTYGAGSATHHLTMYRAPSGALVFGAGTVQWSWGLDNNHDTECYTGATDVRMQQATVNLFADMGVQPTSLQTGLTAATQSTDHTPPTSVISSPASGSAVAASTTITISGTASDVGGMVGGVEVSTDGGTTWHPASGRASWTYSWATGAGRTATIQSRAVDDSGNIQSTPTAITVTVGTGSPACPCSIWSSTSKPVSASDSDTSAIEVGVEFRSDVAGLVTAVRFYKGSTNTGTHIGNLWTSTGTLLASVTFTGETASGWQQANFASPVAIQANTVYVASYHTSVGRYAEDDNYFTKSVDNSPLHALADGVGGSNGVYVYGTASAFPNQTYYAANYWVDIVLSATGGSGGGTPPVISNVGATPTATTANVTWTTDAASTSQVNYGTTTSLGLSTTDGTLVTSHSLTLTGLSAATTYDYRVISTNSGGSTTWPVTTSAPAMFITASPTCPCSIWSASATPATLDENDPSAVELGLKFRSDSAGYITGLRFYKATANTGTHLGHLWTSTGTLLASVTFAGETASGWQQANFAPAVAISANTTYVISYYAPVGHYSGTDGAFTSAGVDNVPLHALANGVDGSNGVYIYGASAFPNQTYDATNYWVDVIFNTTVAPTWSISGTISPVAAGNGASVTLTGVASTSTSADSGGNYTFSGLSNGSYTVSPSKVGYSFTPANQPVTISGANVTGTNFTGQGATNSIAIDITTFNDQSTASTTPTTPMFSTNAANELLLAFIATDGKSGTTTTVKSVSGAGLTWVLVVRANKQLGTSEIWRAFAPAPLTNVSVTATLSQSLAASLTVMSFTGVDTTGTNGSGAIGATGSGNAASGAPTASLVTTRNNSWVIGVGNDWDNAISRSPAAGQTIVHQYLSTSGDTYWFQMLTAPVPLSGTNVTISDTAPTTDRYNLSVCEVLPAP